LKNRIFTVLVIFAIICLFSFSAICTSMQTESDEDISDEEIERKAQEELESDGISYDPSNAEKELEEAQSANEVGEEEKTAAKNEKPTISLRIYEGPAYSKDTGICYYRIEALVTGVPEPVIRFSRDDSNGSWGNKKVQINLKSGETYTLKATASNSMGEAAGSIKLDWACGTLNHDPQISGIGISANDLFTITEYEISAAAIDPDGDALTYKWSVNGGVLSNENINPTKWVTPDFPDTFDITVEVSDGKGGKDTETRSVKVEELIIIKDNPPQVNDIIIKDDPLYTDTKYYVHGDVFDPDSDLAGFAFAASGGVLSGQSANTIYWTTPVNAGEYSITLTARDKQGNEGTLTVLFKVEPDWIVVD